MGFKQETTDMLNDLDQRVSALESLAQRLGYNVGEPVTRTAPVRQAEVTAARTVTAERTSADVTGTDYAAIAFGLAEMKREIKSQFHVTDSQMAAKWNGTVDYFADVFAKSDPSFNRDEFNRLAQR